MSVVAARARDGVDVVRAATDVRCVVPRGEICVFVRVVVGIAVVRADIVFVVAVRPRVVVARERVAVPRCSVVAGRVVVVLRREFVVVTAVVRRLAARVVFGVTSAVAV